MTTFTYRTQDKDNHAYIHDEAGRTVAVFKTIESDETGALLASAPLLYALLTQVADDLAVVGDVTRETWRRIGEWREGQ